MGIEFLKAFAIGVAASVPLGPVCIFVMHKTLSGGRKAGFVSGVGSAMMDVLYALIGVMALSVIRKFIEENSYMISIVGGIVVTAVGAIMAFRDPFKGQRTQDVRVKKAKASYLWQTFFLCLANPGALLLMLGLLAFFNVGNYKLITIAGVFSGALVWWWFYTYVIDKFASKLNINTIVLVNKLTGLSVAIFGVLWVIKAFFRIG